MTTATIPRIVSVDDHAVEPPHLWQERLPSRFREAGPRVVRTSVGTSAITGGALQYSFGDGGEVGDVWCFEDLRVPMFRAAVGVGFTRDEQTWVPITYDAMRPGCFQPKARLADMDVNGVEASLCFPNMFVRFCGQTFSQAQDRDLGSACITAYNDWMVEEWCGDSGGRLIPLCIVPLWDAGLAAAEVRRNASRGVRAVCFSEMPPFLGLPSIHSGYWDPFFAACEETGTVIAMHIGSGSKMPATSDDAPAGVVNVLTFMNACMSMTDFLLSGKLAQFPSLRLLYGECNIGWIPYILERVDESWDHARAWTGLRHLPDPPSSYFGPHVFVAFFKDEHGVRSLDEIGADNVLFETDYPHTDSTWPDSPRLVEHFAESMDPPTLRKVVRGNAIRLLSLDLPD